MAAHIGSGGGGLLHHGGVLLGHGVHFSHGDIDLANTAALLFSASGDLSDHIGDFRHAGDDFAHGITGAAHQLRTGVSVLNRCIDKRTNLFGSIAGTTG